MRLALLVAAALTAFAGVALAEQPGRAANADQAVRHVFVCDRSAETSRTWLRECADHSTAAAAAYQPASAKVDRATRQVFMCDRTAATRRAWVRQYGEMTFVTADEFARAEASNEGWSAPRCMTRSEMGRLAKSMPELKVARAIAAAPSL